MRQRLRTLSGLDAGFLYLEESGTPMHVGSLMLLEAPKKRGYDFHKALTAHVASRLPQANVLRRRLHEAPLDLGHPLWVETREIDHAPHIVRRALPKPGTQAQLMKLVGKLHAEFLPRDRPLWQFVVIDGLKSGELALYSKIHHALLDGQGGIALARALLDLAPAFPQTRRGAGASPQKAPAPEARTRERDVAATAVRATIRQFANLLRALPETLRVAGAEIGDPRTLIGRIRDSVHIAPRTPFNAQVGEGRSFAVASLPLASIKGIAKNTGASLNDVVLTLCAGALRGYLIAEGELPKQSLIAAMPVSLRAAGDAEANNQVSMVQCPLGTDIADPGERLRAIAAATAKIKGTVAHLRHLIPTDFPGLAAPIWASGLSRLWARGRVAEKLPPLANLVISNVPGPPVDLYLAGARLTHYFPVSIVVHGLALNITLQSYAGNLEFGIIASTDVVSRPEAIARGLKRELASLLRSIA